MTKSPFLLCILDGFGCASEREGDAVAIAKTPHLDELRAHSPQSQIRTDGEYVGLPEGQMGNSEVGHMTIGSGRLIRQSLQRISDDLVQDVFSQIPAYECFLKESQDSRAIHLVGLVSEGGVHSHGEHLVGLSQLLNNLGKPVFIHAISDGRDVGMKSGQAYMGAFEDKIESLENVHLSTLIGRFYPMDRDNRWERVEEGWNLFTALEGQKFKTVSDVFETAYANGEYDEYIPPSVLGSKESSIQENDSVFLFNFRADRMRQLTRCFLGLEKFKAPKLKALASMTAYDSQFEGKIHVMYPDKDLKGTLGEIIEEKGMTQLRIAETEKYPHVTYYLNGGREESYPHEDRILVESPKDVKSYDLKPEMALPEVTEKLVKAIRSGTYDFIALNIANGDMVGHSGQFEAAVKAVEHIDEALGKITHALKEVNGQALIIADHGNVEEMLVNGEPCTTHSTNPVPCIYVGSKKIKLFDGTLSNIAPTILELMGIDAPEEMTSESLIKPISEGEG